MTKTTKKLSLKNDGRFVIWFIAVFQINWCDRGQFKFRFIGFVHNYQFVKSSLGLIHLLLTDGP